MENLTFTIELKIPQQRILQQLQIYNTGIEEQTERALNDAFKELTEGDNFYKLLKEEIKNTVSSEFRRSVDQYKVKEKIREIIESKLSSKLDDYAQVISEVLLGNI